MTQFAAKAFLILCCAALAGCTGMAVRDVGNLKPRGSPFNRALYEGYLQLADAEDKELDISDAHYFAERARTAASGDPVEPDRLESRDLPDPSRADLAEGRAKLVAALDGGSRDDNPREAARAQVMFDCWLQEAEESDSDSAKRCRDSFFAALTVLQAEAKAEAEAPPGPYYVMFGFDSVLLDDKAEALLDKVIALMAEGRVEKTILTGHADRSGSKGYNAVLAERRAESIALYLTEKGASAEDIVIQSKGEEAPVQPTADGERAELNRRVEITFQ